MLSPPSEQGALDLSDRGPEQGPRSEAATAPAPELLVVRLAIAPDAAPTLATTLAILGYRDQAGAIRQALDRHGGRP